MRADRVGACGLGGRIQRGQVPLALVRGDGVSLRTTFERDDFERWRYVVPESKITPWCCQSMTPPGRTLGRP
ncbi:hypothetical protein SMICM304S_04137 [Streptomyces microflavus]